MTGSILSRNKTEVRTANCSSTRGLFTEMESVLSAGIVVFRVLPMYPSCVLGRQQNFDKNLAFSSLQKFKSKMGKPEGR